MSPGWFWNTDSPSVRSTTSSWRTCSVRQKASRDKEKDILAEMQEYPFFVLHLSGKNTVNFGNDVGMYSRWKSSFSQFLSIWKFS